MVAATAVLTAVAGYVAWASPRAEPAGPSEAPRAAESTAAPCCVELPIATVPDLEVPPPMPDEPVQRPVLGISAGSVADLDRFAASTGTWPEVFDVFEQWSRDRPMDRALAEAVLARGARLSITWEPWNPDAPRADQQAYSLESIANGEHDRYIDMFGDSIRDLPTTVTIRLMHEMNGNWYPWGVGANGNEVGQFVLAWRHVHDRFAALGVANVEWLWAPNALYTGSAPLAPLYPGDSYVDAVGISNYNWGEHSHDGFGTSWRTFGSLFDASIAALRSLTDRPLWITEVGSSDRGGSKADWLAAMMGEVVRRPEVVGVVWFDHVDQGTGVDWRIEPDPAAAAAWRAGFLARPTTG
ncbi:glycoside hydrolase family 26 protein [Blastococcus sp. SYSU DS0510]